MKKSILISSLIAFGIIGGTTTIILNDASAEKSTNSDLIAVNSTLTSTNILSTSKNETVYILADESGEAKTKFIGSTIYTGTEELPFKLKITYYLDGNEISAKDLAGKSGHVKIVYAYDSTAKYLGKNIPFLGLTSLILNHTNFSNLKLTNGKIITETEDNYIIAGYGIAGLNADLGTDFLPDSFTLEADVNNFKLSDSYTIFTNDILADLDTSKLSDLDGLISSINQLSSGVNKLVSGAIELSNGLGDALNGTKQLYEGSQTLANNLSELKSHNEELLGGASQIADMMPTIASLLQEKKTALETQKAELEEQLAGIPDSDIYAEVRNEITAGIAQINGGITQITASLSKLSGVNTFYQGLISYTDGVAKISDGASTFSSKLGLLVDGETKLYEGSITLKDGLNTVKTSGIDKLVNFANQDLANFTKNARSTVSAASSYKKFGDTKAETVKFIVKTPSI